MCELLGVCCACSFLLCVCVNFCLEASSPILFYSKKLNIMSVLVLALSSGGWIYSVHIERGGGSYCKELSFTMC